MIPYIINDISYISYNINIIICSIYHLTFIKYRSPYDGHTGRILFIPDLAVEEVSHVFRAAFYS